MPHLLYLNKISTVLGNFLYNMLNNRYPIWVYIGHREGCHLGSSGGEAKGLKNKKD